MSPWKSTWTHMDSPGRAWTFRDTLRVGARIRVQSNPGVDGPANRGKPVSWLGSYVPRGDSRDVCAGQRLDTPSELCAPGVRAMISAVARVVLKRTKRSDRVRTVGRSWGACYRQFRVLLGVVKYVRRDTRPWHVEQPSHPNSAPFARVSRPMPATSITTRPNAPKPRGMPLRLSCPTGSARFGPNTRISPTLRSPVAERCCIGSTWFSWRSDPRARRRADERARQGRAPPRRVMPLERRRAPRNQPERPTTSNITRKQNNS